MEQLVTRVIAWNAARYPQQSNTALTLALLGEELDELYLATNKVEALDAIGDILFVAIGALWKIGCSAESISRVITMIFLSGQDSKDLARSASHSISELLNANGLVLFANKDDIILITSIISYLHLVLYPCLVAIGRLSMVETILDAICTSNETKSIPGELTDPSIKANSGASGKGPNYVSPKIALIAISDMPKDE